ncbi:hypothetical protein D3C80_1700930 [compost metagenome]
MGAPPSNKKPRAALACSPLHQLILVHLEVESLAGHQFFVCAPLGNLPVLDNENCIRLADRTEPVGNNEAGPPLHQRLHRFLDMQLCSRIHVACCLVQNQNSRTGQHSAGDRQQLPLSLA